MYGDLWVAAWIWFYVGQFLLIWQSRRRGARGDSMAKLITEGG